MKKIETNLKDCYILEPDKFGDDRGYYSPFFAEKDYVENGLHSIKGIVQGARSKSGKGIVDRMAEHIEKEEKLKEEKPVKWASKKLLEGTIKGIIGGTISSSK